MIKRFVPIKVVNMLNHKTVNIIGAGLAGCEAAYFLAEHGINVNLYEMKTLKRTSAQSTNKLGELVCSNSLKSTETLAASGMLKQELKALNCKLLEIAYKCQVPSGNSLSVNRNLFSDEVTKVIKKHKNICVIEEIVKNIDVNIPTIVAAGPLCENELFENIKNLIGENNCYFYDAIAPIIDASTIDYSRAFWGNRYEKGDSKDFLNCWLYKAEYEEFYNNLVSAETVELKHFENLKVFEGCMPVEHLAKRGYDALRFGPLKPVGLCKQIPGEKPSAIVQLRKEDFGGDMLNMVGFQTNLKFGEQKRVFSLIPALKNAEFIRYGTMHRNSYINAPSCLNIYSQLKNYPNVFFAGQISGVEGYVESIASGLYCAINMLNYLNNKNLQNLPPCTIIGALMKYISSASTENFQPMNANYGIIEIAEDIRDKQQRREYAVKKSMQEILKFKENIYG